MTTDPSAVLKPGAKTGDYELSGSLDFASVPALLKQGYDWLGSASQVRIDLSGVTHCNSAAIGLLLEWLRQARLRKTALRFHEIPAPLLEIARASEVQDLLIT
jgi:phospholipid transport system transporter-binding protein